MAKNLERLFLSAQVCLLGGAVFALALGDGGLCDALLPLSLFFGGCLLGGAVFALALGDGGLCDALLPLSLFFGGAVLGTSACGRYHGKEVD